MNKYCIFGAGQIGKWMGELLTHYGKFSCYVDNDTKKQKDGYEGHSVISLSQYMDNCKDKPLIVCCSVTNKNVVIDQLLNAGLKDNVNFAFYENFLRFIFPNVILEEKGESFIYTAQICVTERCTLKCKKCAHGCFAVHNDEKDMPLEKVEETADIYFNHIDYTENFHLIGGEPLYYSDLAEAISYVGEHYRDKMNRFCITTNGTIIPSKEVLESAARYKMDFLISNYSNALPQLSKHYEQLPELLSQYGIGCTLGKPDREWTDYGLDHVDRGFFKNGKLIKKDISTLKNVFKSCGTPCREIREGGAPVLLRPGACLP